MPEWTTDARTILAIIAAIAGVGYWVGQVNSDRKSFKEFMKDVRDDIKTILKRLPAEPILGGNSPVQLTDFGKRLADQMGAQRWAEELAASLLDSVRGKKPSEVDEFCTTYVSSKLDALMESVLTDVAYEVGRDKEEVRPVLRVVLREELFKLRGQRG